MIFDSKIFEAAQALLASEKFRDHERHNYVARDFRRAIEALVRKDRAPYQEQTHEEQKRNVRLAFLRAHIAKLEYSIQRFGHAYVPLQRNGIEAELLYRRLQLNELELESRRPPPANNH